MKENQPWDWYGWLCDRIPELKKPANKLWIHQCVDLLLQDKLVSVEEDDLQNVTFSIADKLGGIFDIKYCGDDKPQYAYEIEPHIRGILNDLGLALVKKDGK